MNRAWRIGGFGGRLGWSLLSLFAAASLLALAILAAWGRGELLARWHHPSAIVNGTLSVITWVAAVVLWLIPAMDVFGLWVWADGKLASRAARKRV